MKPKLTTFEKIILATIVFLIMFSAFVRLSFAQKVVTPEYVWDAQDLQMWLRGNFIYQKDVNPEDSWKSVIQTLSDRGGDCEDFAVLTSKIFTELLTWNQILVLEFSDRETRHAITVFKEPDGTLSYFDNQYYKPIHADKIETLLNKAFPSWSFAQVTNSTGGVRRNIYRYPDEETETSKLLQIIDDLNNRLNKLEQDKQFAEDLE